MYNLIITKKHVVVIDRKGFDGMVFNKVNVAITMNIVVLLLLAIWYSSDTKKYSNRKFKVISIVTSFLCTGIVAVLPI